MAAALFPAIEKLSGRDNYNEWAFGMKAYLLHEDLWGCIDGTDTTANATEKERRDSKARSKIIMMLHPSNYIHIRDADTAKAVWDKLKKAFEDSGLTRKVSLMRKLITTKLDNCMSMEEYVSTIMSTAQKLNDINFQVSSEWIGTFLLAGLPESFHPMVMAIENSGVSITADYVKVKLLQEIKSAPGGENENSALYANSRSKHRRQKSKLRCYNCNNYGHMAADCKKPSKRNAHNNKRSEKSLFTALSVAATSSQLDWYIDSGATSHMSPVNSMQNYTQSDSTNREVTLADNRKIQIAGKGECEVTLNINGKDSNVKIKEVLHVPSLSSNLLSISQIVNNDNKVIFDKRGCKIIDSNGNLIATASPDSGMYKLNVKHSDKLLEVRNDPSELWHRRLGHPSKGTMHRLQKLVDFRILQPGYDSACTICLKGKQSRKPFFASSSKTTEKLELIHSDLCGPFEVNSLGGSKYFLIFVDDYSHKTFIYFLRQKNQVFKAFRDFKALVENQAGKKIKALRSDNGGEFVNKEMNTFLRCSGIQHQTTVAHNPEQNGKAERMNRTIVEKARCLLIDAGLPKRFWAEAANTAVYLLNRLPTSALRNQIPEEVWTGEKISLNNLKVFGSKVSVYIPKQRRRKLDRKSEDCVFVGYSDNKKAYRVYSPETDTVYATRDTVFIDELTKINTNIENAIQIKPLLPVENVQTHPFCTQEETESHLEAEIEPVEESTETDHSFESESSFGSPLNNFEEYADEFDQDYQPPPSLSTHPASQPTEVRRSERERQPNRRDDFVYTTRHTSTQPDPVTVNEALSGPNAQMWKAAMDDEYNALQNNSTWNLVTPPPDSNVLRSKWIFKTKINPDGSIKYKARLVIKGCDQQKGIDFDETYAPVAKHNSIRYLLAVAACENFDIDHLDATSAFLQGDLSETIFMEQPEEYKLNNGKVCQLKKALYGLKQSSRIWNSKLNRALIDFGLKKSEHDGCIYYHISDNQRLYVAIYVDDIIILSDTPKLKEKLKNKLKRDFKIKDLGPLKKFLGYYITRDRKKNKMCINQHEYIQQILYRFNMQHANPVRTPMDAGMKYSKAMCPKNEEEEKEMRKIPYREAIGSLLYLSQTTRPDICFPVNLLSRFSNNPGKQHWLGVKRILKYLKGTSTYSLVYGKSSSETIVGYSDADWAASVDDRRSTTGYLFLKGPCMITWNTRKQQTVALSSTEAEYMALASATQEAIWLKNLEEELQQKKNMCIPINCDNVGAICLGSTEVHRSRTKHIDVRHHFLREKVAEGIVEVKPTSSRLMLADILTKPLSAERIRDFCKAVNIGFSGGVESEPNI